MALGTWQLQRLAWKEGLLARIAALQSAPAIPLDQALARAAAGQDADFTRVSVVCPGLAAAPFVELYALRSGEAGARLISACALEGAGPNASVLVDRGFVTDTISARPPSDPADRRPVAVTGVLRAPDARNFAAPPDGSPTGDSTPATSPPSPAFWGPPSRRRCSCSPRPGVTPAPLPAEITNRHLEYALTWFGLAVTLLFIYAAMLWRKMRS
jgi:surfeit locus 1 family protein